MKSMSPSEIYCQARNIAPAGLPANSSSTWSACGRPIAAGQHAGQFEPAKSFNDRIQFAKRGDFNVCGWCLAVLAEPTTGKTSGCAHAGGLICLNSDAEKAAFMRNPPEPPFIVALTSIDNPQHIIWAASVSYSRDRFAVRFGPTTMQIDRQRVLSAVDAISAYTKADKKRAQRLFYLSHNLKKLDDFSVNRRFEEDASEEAEAIRSMFNSMNRGELWLTTRILAADSKLETKGEQ